MDILLSRASVKELDEPGPCEAHLRLILEAAVRNGVFDALDGGPKTAAETSAATGASERGLTAIMNALVGLEFLTRDDAGRYALTAVSAALLGNDSSALQTAAASVTTASSYVSQQQTFYGQAEDRITQALSEASQASVRSQQDLSDKVDSDVTSSILELTQDSTDLQAAMASYSKLPNTSLWADLPQ